MEDTHKLATIVEKKTNQINNTEKVHEQLEIDGDVVIHEMEQTDELNTVVERKTNHIINTERVYELQDQEISKELLQPQGIPNLISESRNEGEKENRTINVISMTILKKGIEKAEGIVKTGVEPRVEPNNVETIDLWDKHLSWPKPEDNGLKKKKNTEKLPFAVVSKEWKAMKTLAEKKKKDKEELKIKKKEARAEKRKSVTRAPMNTKEKRRKTGQVKNDVKSYKIGDYVMVRYEEKCYPGIITNQTKDIYEISAMEQIENNLWKWPQRQDQIWYNFKDIVNIISPPILVNSKGIYKVGD